MKNSEDHEDATSFADRVWLFVVTLCITLPLFYLMALRLLRRTNVSDDVVLLPGLASVVVSLIAAWNPRTVEHWIESIFANLR